MNVSDISTGESLMGDFELTGWVVVTVTFFEGVINLNVIRI